MWCVFVWTWWFDNSFILKNSFEVKKVKSLMALIFHFIPHIFILKQCPQWPEEDFNKTFTPVNWSFTGLMGLLQGFQKCFAWNPRKWGIESTSIIAQPIQPSWAKSAVLPSWQILFPISWDFMWNVFGIIEASPFILRRFNLPA